MKVPRNAPYAFNTLQCCHYATIKSFKNTACRAKGLGTDPSSKQVWRARAASRPNSHITARLPRTFARRLVGKARTATRRRACCAAAWVGACVSVDWRALPSTILVCARAKTCGASSHLISVKSSRTHIWRTPFLTTVFSLPPNKVGNVGTLTASWSRLQAASRDKFLSSSCWDIPGVVLPPGAIRYFLHSMLGGIGVKGLTKRFADNILLRSSHAETQQRGAIGQKPSSHLRGHISASLLSLSTHTMSPECSHALPVSTRLLDHTMSLCSYCLILAAY